MANALWQASRAVTKTNCEYMQTIKEQRQRGTERFCIRERDRGRGRKGGVASEAKMQSECGQIAEKRPCKSCIYDHSKQKPSLATSPVLHPLPGYFLQYVCIVIVCICARVRLQLKDISQARREFY